MKRYIPLLVAALPLSAIIPSVVVASDISNLDCLTATTLLNECYQPISEFEKENSSRGTRADTDITYASFRANATYLGTLTAANLDGIVTALNSVLAAPGSLVVKSFDVEPASGASGFASTASSVKGFFRAPAFSSKDCTVTFGTTGSNGSMSCVVTGESTSFGTPPDGNYTIQYVTPTMTALGTANAAATPANFNVFVTGLFQAMTDAAALTEPSAVWLGGDASSVATVFGYFKKSPTTGSWSFSGSAGKLTYIDTAP